MNKIVSTIVSTILFVIAVIFLAPGVSKAETFDRSVYFTVSSVKGDVGGGVGVSGKHLELEVNWDRWSGKDGNDGVDLGTKTVPAQAVDLGTKRTGSGVGVELHGRYKFSEVFGVYAGPRVHRETLQHMYQLPGAGTISTDKRNSYKVEAAGGIIIDINRISIRAGVDTAGRVSAGIGMRF